MTGPALPPPDQPERLSILTAVLLVALAQFIASVAAALFVLSIWVLC
jgi:hypothetical protein